MKTKLLRRWRDQFEKHIRYDKVIGEDEKGNIIYLYAIFHDKAYGKYIEEVKPRYEEFRSKYRSYNFAFENCGYMYKALDEIYYTFVNAKIKETREHNH